jgi:lipopolysaccharide export system permease protein
MRLTGTPLRRIFLPIYIAGALVALFSFVMNEVVVPRATVEFEKTQGAMLGYALTASPQVISNRVFTYNQYSFFVREATKGAPGRPEALTAHDVMIYEDPIGDEAFPTLITANSAIYDNGLWTLSNAMFHKTDSSGFVTDEVRAAHGSYNLRAPMPHISSTGAGFAGMDDRETMGEIAQEIKLGNRTGQDTTEAQVDYQFKMALPLLCLAFALCAPSLAMKFAKTGPFMGVFLSIVMVFVGWNTLLLTKALGISEHISPFLAAWSPDILFAMVGLVMLWRSE